MTKSTTALKETRLRLGPVANEAVTDEPDNARKVAMLDAIVTEHRQYREQLSDARNQLKQLTRFDAVFAGMSDLMAAQSASLDALSDLMKERFIKLDRMHMRTRGLIGSKLTTGEAQERILAQMDALTTNLQSYIDQLDLGEAQKTQNRHNELARMQQLLTEAGSYENAMDEEAEMAALESAGHER